MLIVAGLAVAAPLAGWVIGRPRALALTIIVPLIAVASRIRYEHVHGAPPELWAINTALFTAGFAICVGIGLGLRLLTRPHQRGQR